jgi:hypothetical protein
VFVVGPAEEMEYFPLLLASIPTFLVAEYCQSDPAEKHFHSGQ